MENSEFKNVGHPWESDEDKQLIDEYTKKKYSLLEICRIHKRMPGGILSRLQKFNLIEIKNQARGYQEYLESDLYKEVLKAKKDFRSMKKEEKKKCLIVENVNDSKTSERQTLREARKNIPSDLEQIKKNIELLNKKVDKVLELINAVYEFETTQAE